ncbi:MAG: YcxB family protein [Candidatus Korobacteraceae bacterium]
MTVAYTEPLALSFRYIEEDYVRAVRAHYASRLRLPLDIAVIVGAAALGAYDMRNGVSWFGIAMLSFSGILALLLVTAFLILPHYFFRTQPKFRDEYTLAFSSEGVCFKTIHIDSNLEWSLYTHVLIDAHSYILYYGSHEFSVIPKRVFQNDVQRKGFEQLLTENIPQTTDKTKAVST